MPSCRGRLRGQGGTASDSAGTSLGWLIQFLPSSPLPLFASLSVRAASGGLGLLRNVTSTSSSCMSALI